MHRQHIRLRGEGPQLKGRSWESDGPLRVGRQEGLEVVLADSSVSRRHAEVAPTAQGWVARDLGSTNGTFVNGARVGRAGLPLQPGDCLQCGQLAMTVELTEDRGATAVAPVPALRVESALQAPWDQALERLASAGGERPEDLRRVRTLLLIGRDFGPQTPMAQLLNTLTGDAVVSLGACRGGLALADEVSGRLELRASCPRGDGDAGFNQELALRSWQRGESLLCQAADGPGADGPRSAVCALLRSPRKKLGVLYLERGPGQAPFAEADLGLADGLAASVSSTVESLGYFLETERDLMLHTLTALAQAIELRDDYTGGHTQRVTDYALLLADELGLSEHERHLLRIGTPLHDLGKIGIHDAILLKPGHLTEDEFEYMKSHTWKGSNLLEIIPHLASVLPIVRNHHERWDGKGYPDRLAGRQIPTLGRVVSVADTFDAMTSDRPYRKGLPLDRAFDEIRKKAGTQFDPEFVQAFLKGRPRLEEMCRAREERSETLAACQEARSAISAAGGVVRTLRTGIVSLSPSPQGAVVARR